MDENTEARLIATEQRVAAMESDIKEIKSDVKSMPEEIANRINESIDMKIKLAITETEKKYQAKLIGLLLAIIGEGVGLVISFLK
ncbi:MAG: hypothetical protein IIZ93_00390 [Acidaminococcaceae bacterium]|jgi:hypothetical protein|nr:hypothetical protein [Acidaminococcaceae bacterium]